LNAFRVSLAVVCVSVVVISAFSVSSGALWGSPVISDTVIWKQTLPMYEVKHEYHGNYWSYNESQPFGLPTIVNGVVYVGNSGGEDRGHDEGIYAYDARSGQKLWNYSVHYDEYSPFKVADGAVYVGSDSGLYALSASDGHKLWNYSESPEYIRLSDGVYSPTYNAMFFASPTVTNGKVYCVSDNANLIAFNSATGAILWDYTIQKGPYYPWYATFTSPVAAYGNLYVGCQDHNVYALNADSGQKVWSFSTGAEVYAPLTVLDNVVYASSYDGNVYALDAENGRKLWNFSCALNSEGYCFIDSAPVISGSTIFVGCEDYLMYALNKNDGTELWSFNATRQIRSSPSVQNGYVYFGTETGSLLALDAKSGSLIWNYTTDGGIVRPTVVDGVLYVGTGAGSVYAIGSTSPMSFGTYQNTVVIAATCVLLPFLAVALLLRIKQGKSP
jgi:eukaryotic-like serine/threonine-protein kinase